MNKSYRQLRAELDDLMAWFDQDDIDVEQALSKYEDAKKIIAELEVYLKNTELKISKIKDDI